MALATYTDLKTSIGNWLDRDDLASYLDDFIALAEQLMNYGGQAMSQAMEPLRVREMETRQTASMDTASRFLALPAGFLEMRRFWISSSDPIHRLSYMSPDNITDHYLSGSDKPDYYTIIGTEAEFETIPDSAYTVEMDYFKAPTALSDANTSNDILTNYSGLYLYGSLVSAEPFLQNDERLPLWVSLYKSLLSGANRSSDRGRHSGSLLVTRTDIR